MTDNHNYKTPDKGATDWHIPLNQNFKSIDTDVEVRDTKANRGNYIPNDGTKFHATDTGEIFLGDGSNWNYHGRLPKTTGTDGPAIRIFGTNRQGQNIYYSDYIIGNFKDIGDAIQTAHDDLITAGLNQGAIMQLPVSGQFDFSTPIEINIPLSIIGFSGSAARHSGSGATPGGSTRLNWTGGSEKVITIRGTDDTGLKQNPDNLAGLRLEGFALTNDGGSATNLLYLDGTTNTNPDGSVLRECTYRDLHFGGASDAEVLAEGTVFIQHWDRVSVNTISGVGFDVSNVSNNSVGGPSQWYFYTPYFYSNGAGWSADLASQQVGIFGGTVNEVNGGDGVRLGFRGSVIGTNIEGQSNAGTTGCVLYGTGPWNFFPATCSRWETGLDIGDSANPRPSANNVRFGFQTTNNASEDVLIASGGKRRNWHPVVPDLTITDNHLSNDGIQQKNQLELDKHTKTKTIAVDSTGNKTVSFNINSQIGSYDMYDYAIVATDDGSGGNVSDFRIAEPIAQELDQSGGIDIDIPVISASSSSGATADIRFVFKRYA